MKPLIMLAMAASLGAVENSPYLMKHDTTAHIIVGSVAGFGAGYLAERWGAPPWAAYVIAFATPCLLGQVKERWCDQNYCGKDANSWVLAGAGAVGLRAAWEWRF